jgi:hypothetical protein
METSTKKEKYRHITWVIVKTKEFDKINNLQTELSLFEKETLEEVELMVGQKITIQAQSIKDKITMFAIITDLTGEVPVGQPIIDDGEDHFFYLYQMRQKGLLSEEESKNVDRYYEKIGMPIYITK